MSLPTFKNLELAEKRFAPSEIIDTIAQRNPEFGERIKQARASNISDADILAAIKQERQRSVGIDIPVAATGQAISGALAIPRTLQDFGSFLRGALTQPRETGRQLIGGILGMDLEPQQERSAAEQILGRERAGQLKESLGFGALERGIESIADFLGPGFLFSPTAGPFGLPEFPSRGEISEELSGLTGIDLGATTAPGRIAGEFAGRFAEAGPFGAEAALALGAGGATGQAAREIGLPEPVANIADIGVSTLSLAKSKPTRKDIRRAQKKIDAESLNNLKSIALRTEEELAELSGKELAIDVAQTNRGRLLRQLDSRELSRGEALSEVSKGISQEFTRATGETSNFYNSARQKLSGSTFRMERTLGKMDQMLSDLEKFSLPKAAESSIRSFIERQAALFDETGRISAENAIQLKQNFNNFVDFEFPDLQAKSKFKQMTSPIRKTAVQELNQEIKRVNKDAFLDFRKAERSHQENAERFGKDVVVKIQRAEDPLQVLGSVTDPSDAKFLKEALRRKGTKDFANEALTLEKLILEELDLSQTTQNLERKFEDLKKALSPRGEAIGRSILDLNDPRATGNKLQRKMLSVIDDVSESSITGQAPNMTLKLMQEEKGLELVKKALSGTEEGAEAFSVLKDLGARGLLEEVITAGSLDLDKLKDFLANKQKVERFRRLAGETALQELRNLPRQVEKFNEILSESVFARAEVDASLFQDRPVKFTENPFLWVKQNKAQSTLVFGLMKALGVKVPQVVIAAGAVQLVRSFLPKILNNKNILRLLRTIEAKPNARGTAILQMNREIQRIIDRETQ